MGKGVGTNLMIERASDFLLFNRYQYFMQLCFLSAYGQDFKRKMKRKRYC